MRHKLQDYLLKVHQAFGLTTILVSHDLGEIIRLSDKVIMLEDGKIVKEGKTEIVFGHASVSGKFQFMGTILSMEQQDFLYIMVILIGKNVVKVIADEHETKGLQVGDKVLVASKAFNPIIQKLQ